MLVFALLLAALPPPVSGFADAVEVVEVAVQAAVTDRSGRPVRGLGVRDFRVRENGRAVEVTSVAWIEHGAAEDAASGPASGAASGRHSAPRRFILLYHASNLSDRATLGLMGQQFRAVQGVRRWLAEASPADLVALAVYDHRLRLYQDFTAEPQEVLAALERALLREPPRARTVAATGPSLARHLPDATKLRDATPTLRRGIEQLGRAAASLPGRKHLVLLSSGLGLPGIDRGLLDPQRASLVEVLNAADVAVWAVDLTPPEVEHRLAVSLASLALATGGEYFGHLDGFHKPLRRIEKRLAGTYVIHYRRPQPAAAGYRRIEVEVTRPGLKVSARRGYLASPPP